MALIPGQYSYRGLVIGDGTDYFIDGMDGLDDYALEEETLKRVQAEGAFTFSQYSQPKSIDISGWISQPSVEDVAPLINALRTAFAPTGLEMQPFGFYRKGEQERFIRCVLTRRLIPPYDRTYQQGAVKYAVQLRAPDPREYGAELKGTTGSGIFASGLGGTTFPIIFPLVFGLAPGGAGGGGGAAVATNAGTFPSPPQVRIFGPAGPIITITNQTTGESLSLANYNLAAGDWIDLDFDQHTILLNGISSLYGVRAPDSIWWQLQPGDNVVTMSSDEGGSMTLAYHDCWL